METKSNFFQGLVTGIAIIAVIGFFVMFGLYYSKSNAQNSDDSAVGNYAANNANLNNPSPTVAAAPTVPSPVNIEVTADDHIRGKVNAPVTIVEFSDFQCPYCGRFHGTMRQIMQNYPSQVRWVYKHFPLSSIHPYAQKAAEASECANEQGKFWEFADTVFANQDSLSIDSLPKFAADIGLNKSKFQECLDSGKYKTKVANDYKLGNSLGVSGTPGNFINGISVPGALPYDQIAGIIDNILENE